MPGRADIPGPHHCPIQLPRLHAPLTVQPYAARVSGHRPVGCHTCPVVSEVDAVSARLRVEAAIRGPRALRMPAAARRSLGSASPDMAPCGPRCGFTEAERAGLPLAALAASQGPSPARCALLRNTPPLPTLLIFRQPR